MRLVIMALAVGLICTLGFVPTSESSAATKERSPFVGYWVADDTYHGTTMQMWIRGHEPPSRVKIAYDSASFCPSEGPATGMAKPALLREDAIEVHLGGRCHIDKVKFERWTMFTYDSDLGILIDNFNNTWRRG